MNIIRDIPYSVPQDDVRCMDIYLPEKPNDIFFLYAHGGGLEAGDKKDVRTPAEYLAAHGVTVGSINYRMYPDAHFPDYLWDAAEAVKFICDRRAEYHAEKIYVGGSSAGGYISMMLCFDPAYLARFGLSNRDIAGYFHDAGQPTAHFRVLKERGIDSRRVIVDESCALFHVGTQESYPPMRFIVSDQDMTNRLEQTMLILSTLRHFGHKNVDHVLMHGTHCAYIGKKDEQGESIFGKLFLDFVTSQEV